MEKYNELKAARDELIKKEQQLMVGNDIILSERELKANEIIMNLKLKEIDGVLNDAKVFNVSKHFFEYKDEVKKSELYKILQKMPKGAALHVHDTGLLSPDYVVELTYLDNLYVAFIGNDVLFKFAREKPADSNIHWQLMKDARNFSGDVKLFDKELRKHFTIVTDKPYEVYTDINIVWKKFQHFFIASSGLLTYKPVWEKYFYDTLKAFRDDNIMYIEMRSVLPTLYDLDGNIYDALDTAKSYKETVDRFVKDYPDFYGAKLIYAPLRKVDRLTMKTYIETARHLKKMFPDFVAGFDLVGQEDLGAPLKEFYPELIEANQELDFFLHAGETNWFGTASDENLLDALLLNTKRIGHGYALIKHPVLLEEVKKRQIALEVNVISNTVLKLVADIRNHPLASYLAQNVPVVISSDDPGVWEADPITHDFYVTFVGVSSRHADLRMLKQLAINSLQYSAHSNKDKLAREFENRWNKFIDEFKPHIDGENFPHVSVREIARKYQK